MSSKARNLSDFISDPAIDSTELGDGSVTTAKLGDQAVTPAKLHNTLDLSSKTVTLATDGISGNSVHGGVISDFASTGIDDNASATAITIDSSGNVGVGTASPTEKLVIKGDGARLTVESADMEVAMLGRRGSSGSALDNGYLRLRRQSVTADGVVIDTDGPSWFNGGNVGIGTTNPAAQLHVYSAGQAISRVEGDNQYYTGMMIRNNYAGQQSQWHVAAAGGTSGWGAVNGNFIIRDDTTNSTGIEIERGAGGASGALYIDSTGNVGIGEDRGTTSYTNQRLLITSGDEGSTTYGVYVHNDSYTAGQARISLSPRYSFAYNTAPYVQSISESTSAAALAFGTTASSVATERMRIDSAGNVGIKQSSPTMALTLGGSTSLGDSSLAAAFYCGGDENNWTQARNEAIRIGRSDIRDNFYHSIWSATGSGGSESAHWLRFYIRGQSAQALSLSLYGNGSAQFHSSLSKASGSFKIDHPIPEMKNTHHLVHSFVEGPQADLIYRGRITLLNGQAQVNIDVASNMTDGTFIALNRDVQCFTSNESGWTPVRGSVSGNILTIEAQDNTCTDTISWMVVGERQDSHMFDTDWTDSDGHVIVEPLKEVEQPE